MNVFFRYYLDWFDQLMVCVAYYIMMSSIAFIFVGACFYIGGMVEDLRLTLAELEDDSVPLTNRLFDEIRFHHRMLE